MEKRLSIALLLIIVLTGCRLAPAKVAPTVLPGATVEPVIVPSPTLRPTAAPTTEPTRQPLNTPDPRKRVLIEYGYYQVAGGASFDYALGLNIPELILYADGQILIMRPDSPILQKMLTTAEMCALLAEIRTTGLYDVSTDKSRKPGDPLYEFPADAQFSYDANEYRILINGEQPKQLWIYEDYAEYLVPKAKAALEFFKDLRLDDMQPYEVDQLLLSAEPNPAGFEVPEHGTVLNWPADLRKLSDFTEQGYFLSGERASELFEDFRFPYYYRIFVDAGSEFIVSARPVLPHETYTEIVEYRGMSAPATYIWPFECDK